MVVPAPSVEVALVSVDVWSEIANNALDCLVLVLIVERCVSNAFEYSKC